ncbi:MAG: SPOR domain-containing protein [Pseudomonadota bacterium]
MSATDAAYEAAEDYDAYEDDEEEALPGLFILLMGVLIVAAFSAVVWMAYQQGLRSGRGETGTPLVQAEPGPIKYEVADESAPPRRVAMFDGIDPNAETVEPEVLVSSAEEPILEAERNALSTDANRDAEAGAPNAGDGSDAAAGDLDALAARIIEEDAQSEAGQSTPEPAASQPAERPQAVVERQPEPATEAPATPSGAADPLSGSYVVQVASFAQRREADAQRQRFATRYDEILEGLAPFVQDFDLGEKGVWHRLRVGPFADKAAADEFCSALKARGGDCYAARV